ncbi:receptor homology region, transmembrane domain- and RING domain-containing protein 1-like [Phoenix dactylifera]|uniref:Receptor homology region, transmembrane domain- and RING domain-containing protein 1-like n=1 Tax=Phoenix dactylifera TaxID=42345 RepID=A0A8B7BMG8_PHODC|nr:receptor homology region, transmembrane domain- and RING domain-containing protein 1-like [Phoenix dactylifera]XP_008781538.2 receptor homology region, transmembrane domain- and RING domain-containing protein 1-like [Phoenix dactylifera]XP_026658112.2 receptor homology region, transmembrane domain- and RING domain-containing protein 1-like [Phoenix dactylifera]
MVFLSRIDGGLCAAFVCVLLYILVELADGNVVLIGRNLSRSFDDIEANFAPAVRGSGENGVIYTAEPLDGCTPLTNKVVNDSRSSFALIIRGECQFDEKVRNAQDAGFKAAIVYNDQDHGLLVAMVGTPDGINIPAVFISKASGDVLRKYAGLTDMELWIIPSFENSTWSIMAISFISLLAMSALLVTCFFVRRQHVRRERPRASQIRGFHGMSRRLVKAMPSQLFMSVLEDGCTSQTCAICLEDYNVGEKLRVLPCHHKFHAVCVDFWLTAWRTFCPVCKQDAKSSTAHPPASESTPLLSPISASPSSSAGSLAASPPTPIVPSPPWTPSASLTHSLSCTCVVNLHKSCINSPIGNTSADLRNASSRRSYSSHVLSAHLLGFPLSSPFHSQYISYIPSSSNASPCYLVGSSSMQSYVQHYESEASLSALASTQSLPGC